LDAKQIFPLSESQINQIKLISGINLKISVEIYACSLALMNRLRKGDTGKP
jgi:hypothetical protein